MPRYQVIDPKGLVIGTKAADDGSNRRVPDRLKRGDEVPAHIVGSQLAAWKHFDQVREIAAEPPTKAPDTAKPPAKP